MPACAGGATEGQREVHKFAWLRDYGSLHSVFVHRMCVHKIALPHTAASTEQAACQIFHIVEVIFRRGMGTPNSIHSIVHMLPCCLCGIVEMRHRRLMEIASNAPSSIHGVVQVRLHRLLEAAIHHRLVCIHQRILRPLGGSLCGILCSIRCGSLRRFANCVHGISSMLLSHASNCGHSMLHMRRRCLVKCAGCVQSSICSVFQMRRRRLMEIPCHVYGGANSVVHMSTRCLGKIAG